MTLSQQKTIPSSVINHNKVLCYVALGSNMGDSLAYLHLAIQALKSHDHVSKLHVSQFYSSKPHGPQNQPDYLNAAVRFYSGLAPEALLDLLQAIENENDRVREGVERWGARTLDLDLLLYGQQAINTERLTVPHPRISERSFVLLPLHDLIDDKQVIDITINGKSIAECINALPEEELNNIKELENGQSSNS